MVIIFYKNKIKKIQKYDLTKSYRHLFIENMNCII